MRFEAKQVDALRVRLAEYREKHKVRPQEPLSNDLLLTQMKECPAVPGSFFKGSKLKGLNNKLWRFSSKDTRPEDKTLSAIQGFLDYQMQHDKLQEDLAAEEHDEEMIAIHGYLANGSPQARRVFEAIAEGIYVARPLEDREDRVELHFLDCDRERLTIWIEEHSYSEDARQNKNGTSTDRGTGRKIRKGYGFLSTEKFLLHIFLTGSTARDRVNYFELGNFVSNGHPYLLRVGGSESFLGKDRTGFPPENSMVFYDVLYFRNRVLEAKRRKEIEEERKLAATKPPRPPVSSFRGPIPNLAWGALPNGLRHAPDSLERALIEAVKSNSYQFTKQLLKQNANPNFQDEDGMTVLHHAAACGARTSLRMLVTSGKCDYLIPDNLGRYPSDLAIEWSRDFAVARLLTKKRLAQAHRLGVAPR